MKKILVLLTLIMSFVWIGCQQPTTIIDEGNSTIEQGGGNGDENGGNESNENESTESPSINITDTSVTVTYGNTANSDEFEDFTFELYYKKSQSQSYSQYTVTVNYVNNVPRNLNTNNNNSGGVYNIDCNITNGFIITPQGNKKFDLTKTVLNGTTVKLYVYVETQS